MKPIRIAIIGYGKIAQDQHVPAIAGNARFELVATVSPRAVPHEGVPNFRDHQALIAAMPDIDAVAICTPPGVRYAIARDCIAAGFHTLLEKPPGISLGEVEELARLAEERGVTLFTTWHARFNPAVLAAADALKGKSIASMEIVWHEDVRKWHPGQDWIWEPGGFGVFDPGINALSIATAIFPGTLLLRGAELLFPENRQQPIAARLALDSPAANGALTADFDWRRSEGEEWTITVTTADAGEVKLAEGGSRLFLSGVEQDAASGQGEYPALYQRFIDLIDDRASEVDLRPLRITAEAFLLGARNVVPPFED
jgi:D-galactose 1-dehydrogenase